MVKSSRLFVGCRVSGCFGPFISNTSESGKRRKRERVVGTIIRATDKHKWDVIFDYNGTVKSDVSSRSLTIVDDDAGLPINNTTTHDETSTTVVSKQVFYFIDIVMLLLTIIFIINYLYQPVAPEENIDAGNENNGSPSSDPATDPALDDDNVSDEDLDPPSDEEQMEEEAQIDPSDHPSQVFTEADFLESQNMNNESMRHMSTYHDAWRKIKELKGTEVVCNSASRNVDGQVVWKVIEEVKDDAFKQIRDSELKLFSKKNVDWLDNNGSNNIDEARSDYNNAFWRLWPSTIQDDLEKLDSAIIKENLERKTRYQRPIRTVTKAEFIIFHALLIGASVHSSQGVRLWREDMFGKSKKVKRGLSEQVDFSKYMRLWRFKEIKRYIPLIMEDKNKKDNDDWWRFTSRVNMYNKNRSTNLPASHILVFDESMSAFIPR